MCWVAYSPVSVVGHTCGNVRLKNKYDETWNGFFCDNLDAISPRLALIWASNHADRSTIQEDWVKRRRRRACSKPQLSWVSVTCTCDSSMKTILPKYWWMRNSHHPRQTCTCALKVYLQYDDKFKIMRQTNVKLFVLNLQGKARVYEPRCCFTNLFSHTGWTRGSISIGVFFKVCKVN